MAIFHLSAQVIGRSSGRSSTAAAAYRAAARIVDERTGEIHDFTHKQGVRESFILAPALAAPWMHDRSQLWNGVERVEKRKDAQLAREIEVSLPHELSHEQRRRLLFEFVNDEFISQGMIADVAMHRPGQQGDRRNEHAHIMLTMRRTEGGDFGQKAREWNNSELIEKWRASWAKRVNEALADHEVSARVDHRSFVRQALAVGHDVGLSPLPSLHLGPKAAALEKRDIRTEAGDLNREIAVVNLEHERARRAAQAVAEKPNIERSVPVASPRGTCTLLPDENRLQHVLMNTLAHSRTPSTVEDREAAPRQEHLRAIRALKFTDSEALRVTARAFEEAKAAVRRAHERKVAAEEQGRRLLDTVRKDIAARCWRQAHPLRAWLHDVGIFYMPAAAMSPYPVGSQQQWERAHGLHQQLQLDVVIAQEREAAAFEAKTKFRVRVEETYKEIQETTQRRRIVEQHAQELSRLPRELEVTQVIDVPALAPDEPRPIPRLRPRGPAPR